MSDNYLCDRCGACCRQYLIDVYEVDLLREPRVGQRMRPLKEPGLDGEIGYLDGVSGGGCPFLDAEHGCSIHPTRPSVCVVYAVGSARCQEARAAADLPPLEPLDTPPA